MPPDPHILGDWGSTRLRLWLAADGDCARREDGPGLFASDASPPEVLAAALAQLDPDRSAQQVVLCGMAGARGGLVEAPYLRSPAGRAEWSAAAVSTVADGREVRVLPGLSCRLPSGSTDVLRGEESQVFGAMALDPALQSGSHVCVLPGTHSKWVSLLDRRITGFATAMTGELFALLAPSSLLGAARLPTAGNGTEDDGFADGIAARKGGTGVAQLAFAARTARLCGGQSAAWARGYLSGLLIADEILSRPPEQRAGPIVLIGDAALCARYGDAMARLGIEARVLDGETCALRGLEVAIAWFR